MPVYRLHHANLSFPPACKADSGRKGLLAIGGDLRPERLLNAYRGGIFPWYNEGMPVHWCSPDPRLVLWLGDLRVSRSLAKLIRADRYRITMNRAFAEVIGHCAEMRWPLTWITGDMYAAYCRLHGLGYAHSVEVWDDFTLVGGLYGVGLGRMFFGESMFSLASNTSKLALERLVRQLREWEFEMIDCQEVTPHLISLGAREMPRAEFLRHITRLSRLPPPPCWDFDPTNF
ncbi:MAG: leucyl/phenylalanyl-tRNA--protein transferase [Gammaproteobacteria bacterium]|nr:leucyl/phenylalanyl-tRNA--protein transferase [Gammaproteobacteria bacterium]